MADAERQPAQMAAQYEGRGDLGDDGAGPARLAPGDLSIIPLRFSVPSMPAVPGTDRYADEHR